MARTTGDGSFYREIVVPEKLQETVPSPQKVSAASYARPLSVFSRDIVVCLITRQDHVEDVCPAKQSDLEYLHTIDTRERRSLSVSV